MKPAPSPDRSHRALRPQKAALRSLALLAILLTCQAKAEVVSVSSKVFNGYSREQLPDGSFKPELYVLGEGGRWTRPVNDPEMDKLSFPQIARVVAGPLAKMKFRPAPKSADASLLILVFWGSTLGSYTVGPTNPFRPMIDRQNARIIGYTEAQSLAQSLSHVSFARDIMDELGENRYYVVLQAYDFQTAVKEKKLKALWTTRMSLSESGEFVAALEQMVTEAGRYFGRTTEGLLRREVIKEGSVELAPLRVIEVVPETK